MFGTEMLYNSSSEAEQQDHDDTAIVSMKKQNPEVFISWLLIVEYAFHYLNNPIPN